MFGPVGKRETSFYSILAPFQRGRTEDQKEDEPVVQQAEPSQGPGMSREKMIFLLDGLIEFYDEERLLGIFQLISKLSKEELATPNNKGIPPLCKAIKFDRSLVVSALLYKLSYADRTAPLKDGNTPLHLACEYGEGENALQLISQIRAEDLNVLNHNGDSPLHLASRWGCAKELAGLELVSKLPLEDLTLKDKNGDTPLHIACRSRKVKVPAALIAKLSIEDLSAQNGEGDTPLHIACAEGNRAAAQMLVKKLPIAALTVKNKKGHTPFDVAILARRPHIFCDLYAQFLNQGIEPEVWLENRPIHQLIKQDPKNLPAREHCYSSGEMVSVAVKWLFPNEVAMQDEDGNTPLHLTIQYGDAWKPYATLMVEEFFPEQLVIPNNNGDTALHLAAQKKEEGIGLAIIHKLPPSQLFLPNKAGLTPLHLAVESDCRQVFKALLSHLKLKKIGEIGTYPLHPKPPLLTFSQEKGRREMFFDLLDRGVKPMIVAPDEKEKVNRLTNQTHHFVSSLQNSLLEEWNEERLDVVSPNHGWYGDWLNTRSQFSNRVKKLTDEELTVGNENGDTPLHEAIQKNEEEVGLAIIRRLPPSKLLTINKKGYTPLHLAIEFDSLKIFLAIILKLKIEDVQTLHTDPALNKHPLLDFCYKKKKKEMFLSMLERGLQLFKANSKKELSFDKGEWDVFFKGIDENHPWFEEWYQSKFS